MSTVSRTKDAAPSRMWVLLYGILLAAHQLFIIWDWAPGRFTSKCLLMPVLLTWFLTAGKAIPLKQRTLITLALLASWAGDVLLLFDATGSLYFMLGLGAFLLAHIFYCVYFGMVYTPVPAAARVAVLILVALYGGLLLYILSPYLGDLRWPVRIYAVVISLMLLLALYVHMGWRSRATMLMAMGAAFFVISDSLLAINKFYAPFSFAGVAVMCTYGVAQLFIISGTLLHDNTIR